MLQAPLRKGNTNKDGWKKKWEVLISLQRMAIYKKKKKAHW